MLDRVVAALSCAVHEDDQWVANLVSRRRKIVAARVSRRRKIVAARREKPKRHTRVGSDNAPLVGIASFIPWGLRVRRKVEWRGRLDI